MDKHLFIAGGGNESESNEIDLAFSTLIDGKKLMYIPVALDRDMQGFEACFDWITDKVFLKFEYKIDVPQIDMFLDPKEIKENIKTYDALYLGGGNTFKLLDFLVKNDIFHEIKDFYMSGKPIYGGSAGAIILGKDIQIVSEENDANYRYTEGLNLFNENSIICHYNASLDTKINEYVSLSKHSVIALPENAGIYIKNSKTEKVFGLPVKFDSKEKKSYD